MISTQPVSRRSSLQPGMVLVAAWGITLAVSLLPTILWSELVGGSSDWLPVARVALIMTCLVATTVWTSIRPLRFYLTLLLMLESAGWLIGWIGGTQIWQSVFSPSSQFVVSMFSTQILRLIVALVIISTLLALNYRREDFFLTRGQLDAPAAPIPLLMSQPTSWWRLGMILAVCITSGTLAFLLLAARPALALFTTALPLLPAILVYAALNAFNEEMTYRASFLATLQDVVSRRQALLLTAVYFGLGHYYGVPYGLIGVVMAAVLGWLLGKSMLETRGFFWAWFIHFWQDLAIFMFMALGTVVPGGK